MQLSKTVLSAEADHSSPGSHRSAPDKEPTLDGSRGPLTIIAAHMTDTGIDCAIQDAKHADHEFFI